MSMDTSSPSESDWERKLDITGPASILWDKQECLPLSSFVSKEDNIVLLTPVVVPVEEEPDESNDPFELLGQALSQRLHSVRHVPYTKAQGITGVHVAFIKRAKAVISVVADFSDADGASQPDLAEMVNEVCDGARPHIIVACCSFERRDIQSSEYSTAVRAASYRRTDLSAIASLLIDGEQDRSEQTTAVSEKQSPNGCPVWSTQPWDAERDMEEAHDLWTESLPPKYHLDRPILASILKRDGYALHHVVRSPKGELLGFCATFTTFADSSGDRLIGSIAALVVRKDYQGRGIGRVLHDEAFGKMHRIRGVGRIQLGSSFPRLLYGLPTEVEDVGWFRERGWSVDGSAPGQGRRVADWVLHFSEMPTLNLASAGLSFKSCEITDAQDVLDMISRESARKGYVGWYDIYAKVVDSSHIGDIILGFEGQTLVATAIAYTPSADNSLSKDLPWAARLGTNVGGVTCIHIKDDDPEVVARRDTILTRTLLACCKLLGDQGMAGMFLDAIRPEERGLEYLGFQKYSEYREVWRTM